MAKKTGAALARHLRTAGRSFPTGTAVVILRKTGQVINRVQVREKAFRIETPDLGVLTVETDRIRSIVYKNLPTYPTDVLRTVNSSEFNGIILNDPIAVEADDLGGAIELPKARVLSIIW